jgi:adsorption protein B
MHWFAPYALSAATEIGLFAGTIFFVFALDDVLLDAIWLARAGWRDDAMTPVASPMPLAIAIPAWDEGQVIGQMLARLSIVWAGQPLTIYVGAYANDLATMLAVADAASRDPRIRLVITDHPGPSTKGACLNAIWATLTADRAARRVMADALLLHDAEDGVDAAEPAVIAAALAYADYVQIPVLPLRENAWALIGGHYCDEFAEAHVRDLPVRSAIGAALPTSGVGCAFTIEALAAIAGESGPFAAASLVEDYELGIRLSALGFRGRFIRARGADGRLIATRALFPHRFPASVRQKTRWLLGIALDGWERLRWPLGTVAPGATMWMLWRDRRVILAAPAIVGGYLAMALFIGAVMLGAVPRIGDPLARWLFTFNLLLLGWRLVMRAICTGIDHGLAQAILSVPRLFVANVVLVATGWRAFARHWRSGADQAPRWDKTEHHFPTALQVAGTA